MCDFNKISSFLLAAQAAFLVTIIAVGVGILNSAGIISAMANVGVMIAALAGCATALYCLTKALDEAGKCKGGPCDPSLKPLIDKLLAMRTAVIGVTASLAIAAIVAVTPIAGSVALSLLLPLFFSISASFAATMSGYMIFIISDFNACLERNKSTSNSTTTTFIIVISILIIVAVGIVVIGGYSSGTFPHKVEW